MLFIKFGLDLLHLPISSIPFSMKPDGFALMNLISSSSMICMLAM